MTMRYPRLLSALFLPGLIALQTAEARQTALGPPVARREAALTIVAGYESPLAVEGLDVSGKPLFVPADRADLFLSVDIRAGKGNKNGFGAGEFVPYLSVTYTLQRKGGPKSPQGLLSPLITSHGMRYGNNVTLAGPGTYALTVTVAPPITVGFGRHTDLETGVSRWWKPFRVEWTFTYAPSTK